MLPAKGGFLQLCCAHLANAHELFQQYFPHEAQFWPNQLQHASPLVLAPAAATLQHTRETPPRKVHPPPPPLYHSPCYDCHRRLSLSREPLPSPPPPPSPFF